MWGKKPPPYANQPTVSAAEAGTTSQWRRKGRYGGDSLIFSTPARVDALDVGGLAHIWAGSRLGGASTNRIPGVGFSEPSFNLPCGGVNEGQEYHGQGESLGKAGRVIPKGPAVQRGDMGSGQFGARQELQAREFGPEEAVGTRSPLSDWGAKRNNYLNCRTFLPYRNIRAKYPGLICHIRQVPVHLTMLRNRGHIHAHHQRGISQDLAIPGTTRDYPR
ncbi:hypothetical protein B0H17DRAFT_1140954 [Mycena rosella]|uniref:Uncharacterized protein n=1 Tax=Mycena rosella TaxID=1033263 RepID=A0AAD7D0P5_MYCRO|nr:hypothetical protein B0H17DRAFT_1140954 [Mycena rosella]